MKNDFLWTAIYTKSVRKHIWDSALPSVSAPEKPLKGQWKQTHFMFTFHTELLKKKRLRSAFGFEIRRKILKLIIL